MAALVGAFLFFAALQVTWLAIDRRTLVEERDFLVAARLAHDLAGDAIGRSYPAGASFVRHSPLAPTWAGLCLAVFGCRGDVAVLSLLPFAALLLWAAYRTARVFLGEAAAVTCAVLTLAFHHFAVVEPLYPAYLFLSEFKLDLPLSACVAATAWRLLALHDEPSRRNARLLGLVLAAGLLTRVVFPLYVVILLAATWSAGRRSTVAWFCALRAVPLALLLAVPWHLLHLRRIVRYMARRELSVDWALVTGMPDLRSWENLGYYAACAADMVSWPLLAAAGLGLAVLLARRSPARGFVLSGLGLAYVLLTLHWGKSIRFLAPLMLLAALAVAACVELPRRGGWRRLVAAALVAAAACRMLCLHGFVPGYRDSSAVPQDVLRPSRHDWRVGEILADIAAAHDGATRLRVAVVPFLGPFRHTAFQQVAQERAIVLDADSEWRIRGDAWREELEESPFVVVRQPEAPGNVYAPHLQHAARWVAAQDGRRLRELGRYGLPDGSAAILYRQPPPDDGWERLARPSTTNVVAIFGDAIVLRAVDVRVEGGLRVVRGEWECLRRPPRDFRLFIQQRRGWSTQAQRSFTPGRGQRPITTWTPGLCFVEEYRVPLAQGPGELWLGWFRGSRRLPVRGASRPVLLRAVNLGEAP